MAPSGTNAPELSLPSGPVTLAPHRVASIPTDRPQHTPVLGPFAFTSSVDRFPSRGSFAGGTAGAVPIFANDFPPCGDNREVNLR